MTDRRYRVGELCPLSLDAECQAHVSMVVKPTATRRTWVMSEDRSAAARFADLLTLADTARSRGYIELADAYTERIVSELASCADGLNGPGGHAA